jgi:hypothetical protein
MPMIAKILVLVVIVGFFPLTGQSFQSKEEMLAGRGASVSDGAEPEGEAVIATDAPLLSRHRNHLRSFPDRARVSNTIRARKPPYRTRLDERNGTNPSPLLPSAYRFSTIAVNF